MERYSHNKEDNLSVESPYKLLLEISATGNADARLSANESTYSAVTESSARLGGAVERRYLGGDVDKVKLSYKVADEYISNENSEYAEKCLDLQEIRRYNIFRYIGSTMALQAGYAFDNAVPPRVDSDEDELDDTEERKIGTNPLNGDTDGDMLWDGDEYYIGTTPFYPDSDGDGLSDYEEVELWFDPLDYNPDNDFYNDYEEWMNGTSPYVYDYTAPEKALEFLKGVVLGDFDEPDNIPQLLGQI
ncbi:MAG: thrombospondin type 3 repeat-containing protein, partial [Oscillospiraceae bacterium]|nr:thrombospondin type 3 repeat-containing protein [Oscillospiraceae bacterium]